MGSQRQVHKLLIMQKVSKIKQLFIIEPATYKRSTKSQRDTILTPIVNHVNKKNFNLITKHDLNQNLVHVY